MNKLYRIWYFTPDSRREVARILSDNIDKVYDFLLKEFIQPEARDKVDTNMIEDCIVWNEFEPEDCIGLMDKDCTSCKYAPPDLTQTKCDKTNKTQLEMVSEDCEYYQIDKDYNPCESCDVGCMHGLNIEEVDYDIEREFKTIYGTNEYWDLTGDKPIKANDWHPLLKSMWERDPQSGVNMLVALTKRCKICNEVRILNIDGICEKCSWSE